MGRKQLRQDVQAWQAKAAAGDTAVCELELDDETLTFRLGTHDTRYTLLVGDYPRACRRTALRSHLSSPIVCKLFQFFYNSFSKLFLASRNFWTCVISSSLHLSTDRCLRRSLPPLRHLETAVLYTEGRDEPDLLSGDLGAIFAQLAVRAGGAEARAAALSASLSESDAGSVLCFVCVYSALNDIRELLDVFCVVFGFGLTYKQTITTTKNEMVLLNLLILF